jgi:hypothetical protein
MDRRELFKLIVMSATGAAAEPTVVPPPGMGEQFVDTVTKKPVTEWGQLVDVLMADVPTGTYGRLEAVLKRTHSAPNRYELDSIRITAPMERKW